MKKLLVLICCLLFALPLYAADTAMDSFTDDSASPVGTDYLIGYSGATGYRWTINSITGLVTDISGNAGTATALAADPADCPAGQVATGIAASGALSCTATPSVTTLTGNVTGTASGNLTSANIDDTAYSAGDDDGVTTIAYSKNAVRDKIESVISGYPTAASLHLDDVLTALGIASEATHFGSFTGSTFLDNQTAKALFQATETSLESKADAASTADYTPPTGNALIKKTGETTVGTSYIVPAGPTQDRTVTFDDANQTVAARDRDNTFTGANTLGDGGDDQRIVSRINSTNERWSGHTIYFAQCAASLAFGTPVYIQSSGKPAGADADAAATMPAIGLIVVASTDADTPCTVLTHGTITDTDWNFTTVGATIYTSETAGSVELDVANISDTNDVVQVLGIALHADTLFVNPSLVTIVLE